MYFVQHVEEAVLGRSPRRADRERASRSFHGRLLLVDSAEIAPGRPAGGAATALGTGRGPLTSLRDWAAVARSRFSTGRSIALPNAPNAIAQRELKVLIYGINRNSQ